MPALPWADASRAWTCEMEMNGTMRFAAELVEPDDEPA